MRKRFRCLLIALVILTVAFPVEATAYSNIDLSRVKFSSGSEKLVFKFDTVEIEGEVRQLVPFTKEEIDGLVKEALKETGLTELDIKEANAKVEKARRASEFTKEDIERIKENLLTTMENTPGGEAATILKVIDRYMKSSSWDDIGTASANLLEDSMTEQVKETASGFVDRAGEMGKNVNLAYEWMGKLTSIMNFCEMLENEQAHSRQKWKDIADGAEAKRQLNRFYEVLQGKIDAYKSKSDQAGWSINFSQAMGRRNFTFFSVGNNHQYWYLDMTMKQKRTNEFGSIAGEYEGVYAIRAKHDMSEGFQKQTGEVFSYLDSKGVLGPGTKVIIRQMNAAGFPTEWKSGSAGKVNIERIISGDCKATINESGEITLSLSEDKDSTTVDISGVTGDLKSTIKKSGVNATTTSTFELYATKENIMVRGNAVNTAGSAYGYGFGDTANLTGGGKAGWDKNIWKPWDGTQKTLKLAGE